MPPLRDAFVRMTGSRTCPSQGGDPALPRIRFRSARTAASLPAAGCRSDGPDTPRHPSPCTRDCECCTADRTARGSLASCSSRLGRGDRRPASLASSEFLVANARACRSGDTGARPARSAPTAAPDARGYTAICTRADVRAHAASGISQASLCAAQRRRRNGSSTSRLVTVGGGTPCRSLRRSKAVQTPFNDTKSGVAQ